MSDQKKPRRAVSERRHFLNIALRYWREEKAPQAWFLTVSVLLLVLVSLGIQIGINGWNRLFYDALDRKDGAALVHGVLLALGLVVGAATVAVALVHMRMRLQIKWRGWLTRRLIGYWLADRRFYQMAIVDNEGSNPEFRIAEDTRLATEPIVDFAIGLATAILTAVAFVGILWKVGGSISVPFGGTATVIPGYMVIAALAYSTIASVSTFLISRVLVQRVEEKNENEAQLRYELVRVRESAETIALLGGDKDEEKRLGVTVESLLARWVKVAIQQARMTWIINGNAVLAPIVPLLLGAPKYLNGSLTLGELMQLASAFVQVQVALNWLVENSIRLAEWSASARRVGALAGVLHTFDESIVGHGSTVVLGTSPDADLHIQNLSIAQNNGTLMIADADLVVKRGEKVLVKGGSGTGKSTLIRAMAGLWPWGSGSVLRPAGARMEFMPQRPYMPLGTLRDALQYPKSDDTSYPDSAIRTAMTKVGLEHLLPRLDEADQWSKVLSGGEQQRVAFARTLLRKPDIVIMDEATSALDELSQARVMAFLDDELRDATVLSVGHRPGLDAYHTREIELTRGAGDRSAQVTNTRYSPLGKVWRKLKTRLT